MPRRPTKDDLSRQDLLDAIKDLKADILDPDRPSLYSSVTDLKRQFSDHSEKVEGVIREFSEFKEAYAADKGRVKGWIAGAGLSGAGLFAAIRHFFFTSK